MSRSLLILLALLVSIAEAQRRRHVDYYLALGGTMPVFGGGMDGSGYMTYSDSIGNETTWIPRIGLTPLPSGALGALVDGNDISMLLAAGSTRVNSDIGRYDASLLTLSFSYAYQFFWPEAFRPRVGTNWSFARLEAEHIALHEPANGSSNTWSSGIFSGSGPGVGVGFGWYPGQHLGITLDTRVRYYWWKNLSTDQFDFAELENPIQTPCWETELQVRWIF